jgi:hypothetical protein
VATDTKAALAGPTRPLGTPDIPQFHLPGSGKSGVYAPRLYGAATIRFADRKRKIDEVRRVAVIVPLEPGTKTIDWDSAKPVEIEPGQLLKDPAARASYLPLPAGAMELKTFTRWATAFDRWLARTQRKDVPPLPESTEPAQLRPKRGGVSVELVAIVWELSTS